MIEFRTKKFNKNWTEGVWEEIINLHQRTLLDFEFSYAEYRIGDEIYTELSPAFMDAFKAEKLWMKLKQ